MNRKYYRWLGLIVIRSYQEQTNNSMKRLTPRAIATEADQVHPGRESNSNKRNAKKGVKRNEK